MIVQRNTKADVIARALSVLDAHGLADLTMRRLAAELGIQPSALYHHVASKQHLLAAVADEILARGPRGPRPSAWDQAVVVVCADLRDAVLAYRDGADLVATVRAFGLGGLDVDVELRALLAGAGLDVITAAVGARTLVRLVLGHTTEEQAHLQAVGAGAIDDAPRETTDFTLGVALVVDGLRLRLAAGHRMA